MCRCRKNCRADNQRPKPSLPGLRVLDEDKRGSCVGSRSAACRSGAIQDAVWAARDWLHLCRGKDSVTRGLYLLMAMLCLTIRSLLSARSASHSGDEGAHLGLLGKEEVAVRVGRA